MTYRAKEHYRDPAVAASYDEERARRKVASRYGQRRKPKAQTGARKRRGPGPKRELFCRRLAIEFGKSVPWKRTTMQQKEASQAAGAAKSRVRRKARRMRARTKRRDARGTVASVCWRLGRVTAVRTESWDLAEWGANQACAAIP